MSFLTFSWVILIWFQATWASASRVCCISSQRRSVSWFLGLIGVGSGGFWVEYDVFELEIEFLECVRVVISELLIMCFLRRIVFELVIYDRNFASFDVVMQFGAYFWLILASFVWILSRWIFRLKLTGIDGLRLFFYGF